MPPQESLESLRAQFREALLASAESANEALERLCPEFKAEKAYIAGCWALYCGPDDPASRAIWMDFGSVTDSELQALERFYRDRGERIRIFIADINRADAFFGQLQSRDYVIGPTLCTWWKPLPADHAAGLPGGESDLPGGEPVSQQRISVSLVRSDTLEIWARTVSAGFRETDAPISDADIPASSVRSFFARASRENCQSYLATIAGEPAGGAVLEMRDGVALVRTASVRFQHRRKGVQSALVAKRLKVGSEADCTVAFSMADKGGGSERNLRRAGFAFLQEGCILSRP